jgi:hypothetical protein
MAQIFISYSRKDIDFIRKLARDLESAGYEVWWDLSDLRGGDDWVKTIPAAIASSQYVIVALTPDATESEWVRKEYTQALSLHKKVIPLLLKTGSVPFALNTINFVNFTSGEYADRFKELLSALDFKGKPPEVTPYQKALLSLSPAFLRIGIPIGVGLIILLVILARSAFPPAPPPDPTASSTPTTSTPILALTDTPTVTPSSNPTFTSTSTPTRTEPASTETFTPTPTLTPTIPPAFALPICVYGDSRVNVREGPGVGYVPVEVIEANGTKCPFFSAYIRNRDQELWFQLAPSQIAEFEQLAGKWIYQSGLAAADLSLPPLPICIFSPGDRVEIHVLPGRNEDLLENTLKADGSDCPFFDTRRENEDGMWYRVAPNQKEKREEFGQYAGGWIHADSLVVNTLNLPAVILTPTLIPSQTSTPSETPTTTPTFTRTPSATITPSETPTETLTPTDTQTPTETPAS